MTRNRELFRLARPRFCTKYSNSSKSNVSCVDLLRKHGFYWLRRIWSLKSSPFLSMIFFMIFSRRGTVAIAVFWSLTIAPVLMAQFKEIGPPPFSEAVAHQRMRTLLDQVDSTNARETIDKLSGWTPWFRSVLDEELIAAWQRDSRQRLTGVMEPLADARVATAVVEFSWRTRTEATLNPSYAPMFGQLMARYPESGAAFVADLLGPMPPDLSPLAIETVCRILIDMPDVGTWHESALRILPRYRPTADRLLAQDRRGTDQEKSYHAQIWQAELRGETPGAFPQANQPPAIRRRPTSQPSERGAGPIIFPSGRDSENTVPEPRPETTASNRAPQLRGPNPAPAQPAPAIASVPIPPADRAPVPPQPPAPVAAATQSYNGPNSGTLECTGNPVPQNAEYVFRNLPPLKLNLDYDQRVWDARLTAGENQTQRLILKNKSSGPQKRCVVHWTIAP